MFYLEDIKDIYNPPTNLVFSFLFGYQYCVEIDTIITVNGIIHLSAKANKKMVFVLG